MLTVALTGNVAAGKSTVLGLFRDWGAYVTDADATVRDLQRPGTPVFDAILDRFGAAVRAADGTLDRDALRRIILADPAARADLNAIVHPAVAARREEQEAEARRRGARIVVHDIPLLFEAADPGAFDRVVLVEAPEPVRRERLVRLRGLPPDEADRLIAAQWPSERKHPGSHHIVLNDGDLDRLRARAREVWDALRAAAGAA